MEAKTKTTEFPERLRCPPAVWLRFSAEFPNLAESALRFIRGAKGRSAIQLKSMKLLKDLPAIFGIRCAHL
jgi:hypothetical protein